MVKSYSNKKLFLFFTIVFFLLCLILYYFYTCRQVDGMSIILNDGTTDEDMYGESVNKDGYLDGIDVIYYINLDRSVGRRNHMERILNDSVFDDILTNRVPAYDGKKIDMSKYFVIDNVGNKDNSNVTNIEYACLMSHLESIRTFSESPNEIALIFEDDMTLEYKKYWHDTVGKIIKKAPSDWGIIQMCYNNINGLYFNEEYKVNMNNDANDKNYAACAGAYIINKKSAIKLMQNIYKNGKYHINNLYYHVSDVLIFTVLKTYVYNKPYFTYITDNTSTIHQDHVSGHVLSKNIITNYLDNLFSKNAQSVTQNADASIIIR